VKGIEPEAGELLDEAIQEIKTRLREANQKITEAMYMLDKFRDH
jgi:hypothetical protein